MKKKIEKDKQHLSVGNCTRQQYDRWERAAKRDQRSLSSWVRKILDAAAGEIR